MTHHVTMTLLVLMDPLTPLGDDVGARPGPQQRRRLPQHRPQPDVPPAGGGERGLRQAGHRESGEEAEGEEGRTGLTHHRRHHQRGPSQQVCDHPEDAGRAAAGTRAGGGAHVAVLESEVRIRICLCSE